MIASTSVPFFASSRLFAQEVAAPVITRQHVVRAGETCASIARRYLGDAHRWDLLHEHNTWLGPPPHRLAPGTVLRIPVVSRATGPDAHVTASSRRVEARAPADAAWREARRGLPLTRGWRVTTHDRASAEITFRDTTVLEMRERTLVIVFGPTARTAGRRSTEATLERGVLRARLAELAGETPVAVETPDVVAELAGGEALVSVDEVGTSRVANHGGRDAIVVGRDRRRARVRLAPGMGTRVSRGGRIGAPRRLLPAPRWDVAPADSVAGIIGRGATLEGSWFPVPGAVGYRVEVMRGEGGADLVAALELGAATRFHTRGTFDGVVRIRVSAVDRDHLEGPPSEERVVRVLGIRVRAPGASTASDWPDLPVDPSARVGVARVFVGSTIEQPDGARCRRATDGASSDATSGVLRLTELGPTEIRCVLEGGQTVLPFALEVVPIRVTLTSERLLSARGGIPRGESVLLRLAITSDVELPADLRVRGDRGLEVGPLERESGGSWALRVGALDDAPERVTLRFVTGSDDDATTLASLPLAVAPARVRTSATRPSRVETPLSPDETWGALPLRESVGLRDELRGSGAWTALALMFDRAGESATVRAVAGLRLRLFSEPVRIAATLPVDLVGGDESRVASGSLDPVVAASWSFVTSARVGLSLDVAAWLPLAEGGDFQSVRWVPSLEGSYRVSSEIVLRSRQAAIFDARDDGARLWASAWGGTVRVFGALSMGAEVDLAFGREGGDTTIIVAPVLAVSIRHRSIGAALGLRLGATEDARRATGVVGILLALSGGS